MYSTAAAQVIKSTRQNTCQCNSTAIQITSVDAAGSVKHCTKPDLKPSLLPITVARATAATFKLTYAVSLHHSPLAKKPAMIKHNQ